MDEIEVNDNDGALNFGAEADDPFAIPPPLDGSLLFDDPATIAEQNEAVNPEDNVDGDQTQDSAEKKKKKRAFKPRVNLNEERLCSKKGIEALKHLCSDVHFKGKGHEVSDLNKLLHRFEHWAQCLMPRWPFDNVVQKCEVLGSKSRVKNELKRIRRDDEAEVLRGELEDNEDGTGQADKTNEENSTEATSQQDVSPEEQPSIELTEEQLERIRRNRLLAFEKREAKRRRLEEESQTQSQLEDGPTNVEQEMNQNNSSSEQPSTTNVSSENMAPEEPLEDMVPDEIDEDTATNSDQNGGMDNINNEAELTDVPESDDNVESHNMSEKDGSSQVPSMSNEREQEENDDISDEEDDEILNRSAFDVNPASPDTSLSVDTNNEPDTRKDEVLEDLSHPNNKIDDAAILQNDGHETDNPTSDNAAPDYFLQLKLKTDLPPSCTGPDDTVTKEASTEQMDVVNPTTE